MKRSQLLLSFGVATLAVACGSGPSVKTYGEAIKKPTGTVSKASTSTAVTNQNKNGGAASGAIAGAFGGLALPSGIVKTPNHDGLHAVMGVMGAMGHADGANLLAAIRDSATGDEQPTEERTNPALDYCGDTAKYKAQIEAMKQLDGKSGSAAGNSFSYTFKVTCKENNTVVEIQLSVKAHYAAAAGGVSASGDVDIALVAKFGAYKGGLGGLYGIEGHISGTGDGQTVKYDISGGFGFFVKDPDYVAAFVLIANKDSYVFFSLNDTTRNAQPTGSAVCIKGANGSFIIKCTQESEDSTTCGLWKSDGTAIEGNTETAPTGAECDSNPTLDLLGEFSAL